MAIRIASARLKVINTFEIRNEPNHEDHQYFDEKLLFFLYRSTAHQPQAEMNIPYLESHCTLNVFL